MTKSSAVQVGIHEAKTRLSQLLRLVEAGEEVEILRSGEPVAKIVRIRSRRERALGFDEGRLVIPDDFDEPLPEDVLESFYR